MSICDNKHDVKTYLRPVQLFFKSGTEIITFRNMDKLPKVNASKNIWAWIVKGKNKI
jgi:hypothetical protein